MILQRVATRLPFQLARRHLSTFKKPITHNTTSNISKIINISVRNGGGSKGYRCLAPEDPLMNFFSDSLMTIVWAYMFWNLYHHGGTALNIGVHVPNYELATDAQALRLSKNMSVNENREKNTTEKRTTSGTLFKDVEHFVNTDGQYIFCKYWKPKDEPKALILLLHGYAEHCIRYDRIANMMTKLGFLVFSHDQVCHGESEGTKMDIVNYRVFIRDALQHVNIMKQKYPDLPLYLFGHSMGGGLSVILAHENSDLFKFVVLSSPMIEKNAQATPVLVFFGKMLANVIPKVAAAKLDANLVSRDENQVKAYVDDKLNYVGPVTMRSARELHRITADLVPILPKVTFPFVVFHGDADGLTNPKGSQDLVRLAQSKDKAIKLFPGGYHELIHDEKNVPEEFLEDIKQHLLSHM